MVNFANTGFGKRFFGKHLPELVKGIQDVAAELKRRNDLLERQLPQAQKETK